MNKSKIIVALVFGVSFFALSACTSKRTCQDISADYYKGVNAPGLTLVEILTVGKKYKTEFRELGCPGKIAG